MQGVGQDVLLAVVTDSGDIEPGEHADDRSLRVEHATKSLRGDAAGHVGVGSNDVGLRAKLVGVAYACCRSISRCT